MSHYGVLVCLPEDTELAHLDDVLGEVLERYNENRAVDRYRDYEDGSPSEHWWAKSIRRAGEKHGVATYESELAAARREKIDRPYEKWTPEERAEKEMRDIEEAASWLAKFGDGPWTWAQVVEAYNAKWHPGNEVSTGEEDDSDERLYLDEDGRAYTWSTYNPESKWDYWRIGGRWREYFVAKEVGPGLITSSRSWDSPAEDKAVLSRLRVDGGPKRLLDFDAMRDEAAERALKVYDQWQAIVAEHGNPPAWRDLIGLVEVKEISIETARFRYGSHPAIEAARKADIDPWGESIEEKYGTTREEFEAITRRSAVPPYAIVRLDGEWMSPGRMGWFGMSSDEAGERDAYAVEANAYLDSLSDDTLLVVLDFHI